MQHHMRSGLPTALAILGFAACTDVPTATESVVLATPSASASTGQVGNGKHVVILAGGSVIPDFAARVEARGGTVDEVLTGAGVAVVSGLSVEGAADLASTDGVSAVAADRVVGPDDPAGVSDVDGPAVVAADAPLDVLVTSPASNRSAPDKAKYYPRQWNLQAIQAGAAWSAGYLGSAGVSVFILDTGIDYLNPDLLGLVDLTRSTSFVPASSDEYALAEAIGRQSFTDFHSHGTGVAALISSNADSLAGVTQKSTLVSVKVLDRSRRGAVSVFIRSIVYAADHGADVIHFSFAFEGFVKRDSTGLVAAFNRAINYAHRKGAVMVAAAGNLERDFDHDQDWWSPCTAPHVICVSATGPTSAAGVQGPWAAGFDSVAPYTNFGRSTISVAGPGSTLSPGALPLNTGKSVWLTCSRTARVTMGNPRFCTTGARLWESTGTSFGAAVTSGLAALLVSRIGRGQPDRVRAMIEQSADDLGAPGTDAYYGKGRINVARAMKMLK